MSDYYSHSRPELRPYLPAQYRRVLEVGCAEGRFAGNYLPGTEVWGVEPSQAAEQAAKVLHRAFAGTFEQCAAELPEGYFDLLVINDVIEHMPDDAGFLKAVQAKLAPGAMVMGSIPNMRYWPVLRALIFQGEWRYTDEGVLDRTHLRFYTQRSFRRLLEDNGFSVVRFGGINNGLSRSRRFWLWLFSAGRLDDVGYLQFAFLAQRKPRD